MSIFLTQFAVGIIDIILKILPDVNVTELTVPDVVIEIVNIAWFFLPMNTFAVLFSASVSITLLRFVLAIILRIKSFVPGSGGT